MDHEDSIESTFLLLAVGDSLSARTALDGKIKQGVEVEMHSTCLPPLIIAIKPAAVGVRMRIKSLEV